jgi:hypothetical protein
MIAPVREIYEDEQVAEPILSEAARVAAARLLPIDRSDEAPPVSAWQAWLMAAWVVATGAAYVAITLGWTR